MSFRQREILGKQLWHAFRHFVPPQFLNGFIAEYGPAANRRRLSDPDYIEPGFRDWIIARLCENSDNIELRDGQYPGMLLDDVAHQMGLADDFTDDDEPALSGNEDDWEDEDDDGFDWDDRSRAS